MSGLLNEFREDLVSGDWVLFTSKRKKRPHKSSEKKEFYQIKEECPFEDPEASGQNVVATYFVGDDDVSKVCSPADWSVKVITNKYPAVEPGICDPMIKVGPFSTINARGQHEVVFTKDHDRDFGELSVPELARLLRSFKQRYRAIAEQKESCGKYILIFHNYGQGAGASVYHPHTQIMSTPILPPDILRSISGSQKFYEREYKKVHDVLIEWELQEKKRILYQNDHFIAFCPFVSKLPYEMRIFPRVSNPHFELSPDGTFPFLAEALIDILGRMNILLDKPDYNMFIHTAPIVEEGDIHYEFYHWHIEILPKTSLQAGFEMGSGVDINVVDPDDAAKELHDITLA